MGILEPDGNGGKVQGILWTPLQWILKHNPGRPPVPHDLQRGSERHHFPLGDGGGANGGGRGGTCSFSAGPCTVFLRGQRNSHVAPALEVVEVI